MGIGVDALGDPPGALRRVRPPGERPGSSERTRSVEADAEPHGRRRLDPGPADLSVALGRMGVAEKKAGPRPLNR